MNPLFLFKRIAHPPWKTILWLAGVLLLIFSLAACQPVEKETPAATEEVVPIAAVTTEEPAAPAETEPPPPEPTPTDVPEPTPLPDQSQYHTEWADGVHGKTYDVGKGPNTYCSRCHSPQNWDPASTTDRPPNCVTCKFPQDPEVRQATTMSFVEEKDWKGIGCETCHQLDENSISTGEIAWLNVLTNEYEPVATVNELCGKCHADTAGVQASGGRGVTHGINLGGSAHLNWAGMLPQGHRPSYCSDCHNPHTGEPKQCTDCHTDVLTSETHMKGTNAEHANVTCLACHDANGMEVGPDPSDPENGAWTTIVNEMSRSGEMTSSYVKSHSISWEVACDRCHFAENPFELSVLNADGTVPEEE
jgi:hypothetical protein